jgi:hypothetical protein
LEQDKPLLKNLKVAVSQKIAKLRMDLLELRAIP